MNEDMPQNWKTFLAVSPQDTDNLCRHNNCILLHPLREEEAVRYPSQKQRFNDSLA